MRCKKEGGHPPPGGVGGLKRKRRGCVKTVGGMRMCGFLIVGSIQDWSVIEQAGEES